MCQKAGTPWKYGLRRGPREAQVAELGRCGEVGTVSCLLSWGRATPLRLRCRGVLDPAQRVPRPVGLSWRLLAYLEHSPRVKLLVDQGVPGQPTGRV